MIKVGLNFQLNSPRPIPRWNFRKANWDQFKGYIEKNINRIPRYICALPRFQKLLVKAAKINIPRGFKRNYLPGWSAESEELYKEYTAHQTAEKRKNLLASLDATRPQRWIETVEHLDMERSSREAWALLKRLEGKNKLKNPQTKIKSQSIATILIENSRGTVSKDQKRSVKHKLRKILATSKPHPVFKECFSAQEMIIAISDPKTGKAPGRDRIHPEFLHNLGPRALQWLSSVYYDIFQSGQVSKTWKEADVIAIQKPGKPEDDPKSYRPISLLSVMSK